jgi:hypothetical protein
MAQRVRSRERDLRSEIGVEHAAAPKIRQTSVASSRFFSKKIFDWIESRIQYCIIDLFNNTKYAIKNREKAQDAKWLLSKLNQKS